MEQKKNTIHEEFWREGNQMCQQVQVNAECSPKDMAMAVLSIIAGLEETTPEMWKLVKKYRREHKRGGSKAENHGQT